MLQLNTRTITKSRAHGLPCTPRGHISAKTAVNNSSTHRHLSARKLTVCRFRPTQQPTADAPSSPVKLAKEELQSLQAVLNANSIPSSTTDSTAMAVDQVPDSVVQQMLQVINKGKEKEVEDLQQLEGFMLLAEQLHRQQGSSKGAVPSTSPQTVDVWQVCKQMIKRMAI